MCFLADCTFLASGNLPMTPVLFIVQAGVGAKEEGLSMS